MQEISSRQGAFLICNPSETVQRSLIARGHFEPQSIFWALIVQKLKEGVVVDIGANIGAFSIGLATYGCEIDIVAVEPQPLVFNHLSANILVNRFKNIRTVHAAVGGDGCVFPRTIAVPLFDVFEENFTGSVSLNDSVRKIRNDIPGVEEPNERAVIYSEVRLIPLDELLSGVNPSFLKVDVEGMELEVFRSGENALRRDRPFLYFEAWTLKEFSELRNDLLSYVESLGYRLLLVGEDVFAYPDIHAENTVLNAFDGVSADARYVNLVSCIGFDHLKRWRNQLMGVSYASSDLQGLPRKQVKAEPLFSVVITTYNRPKFLLDALSSVAAQKNGFYELIVVNDNGLPVEEYLSGLPVPVQYIRMPKNSGPGAARNRAISAARGEYLLFLDDDDQFLPNHLGALEKAISESNGSVIYSDARFITETVDGDERRVLAEESRYRHSEFSLERLLVDNYIPINTLAIPAALARRVGGFDEGLEGLEDWEFLLRLAARSGFVHLPQTTVEVRMRVADQTPERRSEQASQNYGELYQEIYRRHSDLGSEQARQGRAAQLRRLGVVAKGSPASVRNWLAARILTPVQERLVAEYSERQKEQAAQLGVVIIDLDGDDEALTRSINSIKDAVAVHNIKPLVLSTSSQSETHLNTWVQVEADNWVAALNKLLAADNSNDWILLVRAGDELTASGLQMVSLELLANPQCRAIYCDALYRQADGDYGAALRPDFNLDYLLSFPRGIDQHWLFNRAYLVSLDGFDEQMGEAMELDLILRLVNQEGVRGLGHIPEPLVISAAPTLRESPDERSAILSHLQARGYSQAQLGSIRPGQYRVEYGHPEQPMVSVVIVVRDDLTMAQRCVMSILENTRYPNYEILLIDNQSQESSTVEWLMGVEQMGSEQIKVMRSTERLSHSEACNQAALNAGGDYLLLLRSDVAVIDANWLDALMNHGQRPEVGVVGARTVNAEGLVTHAGLVLGLEGPAGSVYVGEPLDAPGYMQRLQVDQNISAVADSCLLVRKSLYVDVGGMDAQHFSDQGADVDLCLRIAESGHMLVWTPRATLLHGAEKRTMPVETEDELYARWLPRLARDPAYNPNFSLAKPGGYKLADSQISWRPLDVFRPLPVMLAHPADETGCGQYRIIQPFTALKTAGLIDGAVSRGLMHVTDLERYDPDVILLQRQISNERLEAMRRMKAFSRAFKIYELDDYLPNLPIKSVHRQHMPKDIVRSLRRGLAFVDRFVVSTEPLAEAFADFHSDIRVMQNSLDPQWWGHSLPESVRRTTKKPRIGWAGGASHTGDLEMIVDVVKALAGEVEWVFFGMCPDKLRPYVDEFHGGVPIAQYPATLARLNLDLALAPVEQNLFNECKSNLRLLEYGACGYPVICSDLRCYEGNLPATRVKNRYKDWVEAIRMHLADRDASEAMGDALREAVRSRWMLDGANLELWRKAWLPE